MRAWLRLGILALLGCAVRVLADVKTDAAAQDALRSGYPALYKLYQSYPSYRPAFTDYANRQGFRRPVENLATVVHELIHIDSSTHQGFFIDGIYYEPYLRRDAWPSPTNEQVKPYLLEPERGVIYRFYLLNTPQNHLGNVVDEINAYGHVLPFVCRNEPDSTDKQVKNLIGFLHLTEGYLRTLRTGLPAEYLRFSGQKEARGVFGLAVQKAWNALHDCGVSDGAIPAQEARFFLNTKAP